MNKPLRDLTKEYWRGATAYGTVQKMKAVDICKYDMDGYRILLMAIEKMYRDKA